MASVSPDVLFRKRKKPRPSAQELGLARDPHGSVQTKNGLISAADYVRLAAAHPTVQLPSLEDIPLLHPTEEN